MQDPGNLTSIVKRQTGTGATQLSSQTLNAVRSEALSSHSPSMPFETRTADMPEMAANQTFSSRRRRRNTLPSVVLTEQEAQTLEFKRRSRSADALNELIEAGEGDPGKQQRDRNDEIAYWRHSALQLPPLKIERTDSSHLQSQTSQLEEQRSIVPVQSFDFGLPTPDQDPLSLEDRVNTLEVKLFDFEYSLAKLQGYDIAKPTLPTKPSKRRSIHDLFPNPGANRSMKSPLTSSSVNDLTWLSSPDDSPLPSTEDDHNFLMNRSSKATTIRPSTARRQTPQRSAAPSPSPSRIDTEHYDTLLTLIKEEQAARREMETQILGLQKEVEMLRTPVYAEIRPITYPTSSPESMQEATFTPKAKTLHRTPAFQLNKTPHETSRFSMTDGESDTDDGFQDIYETPSEKPYTFKTTRGSPMVAMV